MKNIYKFLYIVSAVLFVAFVVAFFVDACKYNEYIGSAPLYVYLLVRALEFALPSVIVLLVALLARRKTRKKSTND